ncbi:MAG: Biofilm growth-associated repressor [Firmicutes bacterium ADurb.Bin506]|nr:MAG: Biofilm growth-associated repressor [Firmicutes bacterium ADurb.Bin506]
MRARALKALANPVRLRIVNVLCEARAEMSVSEIAASVGELQPTVSKHLSILRDTGFVQSRRAGLAVLYSSASPCGAELLKCIDGVLAADVRARSEQVNAAVRDADGDGGETRA